MGDEHENGLSWQSPEGGVNGEEKGVCGGGGGGGWGGGGVKEGDGCEMV